MEANSEEDNPAKAYKNNASNSNEGQSTSKPKRQMKSPFQLEQLEKAYASETYPSEAMRVELSEKLGLSDRQLQMWFCHRRLKDKKETPVKKLRKTLPLLESPPREEFKTVGHEPGSDYESGSSSGSGSSPHIEPRKEVLDDLPMRIYHESSPQSVMELRAIACVEAQLGEPLREDGPILGMEFDRLPPDAFGAAIVAISELQKRPGYTYEGKLYERLNGKSSKASARALHEYQFLQDSSIVSDSFGQSPYHDPLCDTSRGRASSYVHGDEPLARVHGVQGQMPRARLLAHQDKKGHIYASPHRDDSCLLQSDSFGNNRISGLSITRQTIGPDNPEVFPDTQIFHNNSDLRMDRKRKTDEAHESRICKELEKQENLRRKSEERMRKEMERQDRERRKEEERLMRERQREEERLLREQKRELERREKYLQKEHLREEKRRQKEELRREKDAVRRKAAVEKATARRIAKESLDLIEDEQLELMELAAASKGLQSIVHLDYDTLQNLESFRDSLRIFPPESVQFKRPIAIQPWMDSEENMGNLLMVWRFFITFADVMGLWPFTLDEFVQAFHDYDSRLLGEIHVALLKLIIKDIEDVARTPTGLGTNQYSVINPEGGHPQIVEGAYMWGFNIRNWQRHLNPLTWHEIFRQLALSAGFGPQLRKRSAKWTCMGDNDEIKGYEDVVSTLRNGSAAENAFALMREKGLLLPRRSRHRLTPGTVKFAAFHVLSLEGSKGLTVLELAEKIQKSGLRDLTTSKTPEASISVALTRDQKLFERIAPSTYCVRAAFRKDPADAEAVLSAARKKIRIFENGFLGGEDAEDVERDEDSEGNVDEDPEVDDLATPMIANKSADHSNEVETCSASGKENVCSDASLIVQNESKKNLSSFPPNALNDAKIRSTIERRVAAPEDVRVGNADQENIEIDESKSGESWIQGFTEGEYCHLSVEERLNALVALVGVANEGNCIRVILEDRLEAANALKRQMWAEAQLDRSRLKEDVISKLDFQSSVGGKVEAQVTSSVVEGDQSPLLLLDGRNKEASPSTAEDQKSLLDSANLQNHLNSVATERALVVEDPSTNLDNFLTQQNGYTSKRARSQLKAYIGHMAEETYVYRSLPLGQDRRHNRYWQFVASASRYDPCSGRIFVELHDGNWRVIDSEEAFDALLSSLDSRGVRESHLRIMMQKIEASFKENIRRNLQSEIILPRSGTTIENEAADADSSPNCSAGIDSPSSMVCGSNMDVTATYSLFRIELGRNELERKAALKRYEDFQKWMWKECFNSLTLSAMKYGKKRCMQLLTTCELCLDSYLSEDTHCASCHQTFSAANEDFNFSEHLIYCEGRKSDLGDIQTCLSSVPLGIRLLKTLLSFIEVSVPPEALESFWTDNYRKSWGRKLSMPSSNQELLEILTLFESAIKRDCLSSSFEMTKELLGSSISSVGLLHNSAELEPVSVLPWIPKNTAAVALRLFDIDASIMYTQQKKAEPSEEKSVKVFMKLPSRCTHLKSEAELKEVKQDEHFKEENFTDLHSRRSSYKRGQGSRDQRNGTKKVKVPGLRSDSDKRHTKQIENLDQALKLQGRRINVQGPARGRRTVRRRREEKMVTKKPLLSHMTSIVGPKRYPGSQRNLGEEEWDVQKDNMEGADNSNSLEAADSDDNNLDTEGYEKGTWEQGFDGTSNGWKRNSMEVSDDEAEALGDNNGVEDMRDEDSEGDIQMSDGSDGDGVPNKVGNDEELDSEDSDDYSE